MSVDRRQKNAIWWVTDKKGDVYPRVCDGVTVALLMDLRDELQALNTVLQCKNFRSIPTVLRDIRARLATKKRTRKAGRS